MSNDNQRQAAPVAQPALPKLPSTPEEVVAFIGPNFGSLDVEGPIEDRVIRLTVHDLLSAFQDHVDFPTEQPAQQVEAAGQRITQAEIDYIGEQWDECMYDAPGMMIDIGQSIRAELAKLNAAPTSNS